MSRSALAKDSSGILEAVAWLQLLRCAFAGGFCGILDAFQRLFLWLQKATLGTSLPSNVSQRPCQRLFRHSGGSIAWLQLLRCAFAGGFCGILGAFQKLFLWLQKQR